MAAGIGLGIDESYMVAAGRGPLQLGYFDHPLMSWWMARGMADLAGSEAAVVVRLPFIALFAVSTWLMARLGTALSTPRGGLWAAIAFNLSPVFGVTTGGWVLPDGPLVASLLAMVLCLLRALPTPGWRWWLAAGLFAGVAMLSKYTASLSILGGIGFVASDRAHRRWLARPQPYVAALLAALVFSPTLVWNMQHGWASLAFQGGRATANRLHLAGPLITFAGEALYLLPWIWLGLLMCLGRGFAGRDWRVLLLCWLAAPPILLFAGVSLWSRQVLFHWAAPGYLMLFPLLGAWLADRAWAPRAARATAALLATVAMACVVLVRSDWRLPGSDPLLQARTWSALRPALTPLRLPIAATSWSDAGKVAIGMGAANPVFCLNPDAREFAFSTTPPPSGDVVVVAPGHSLAQMHAAYDAVFTAIEPLPPVRVGASDLAVYIGHGLRGWPHR